MVKRPLRERSVVVPVIDHLLPAGRAGAGSRTGRWPGVRAGFESVATVRDGGAETLYRSVTEQTPPKPARVGIMVRFNIGRLLSGRRE